MIIKKVMIEEIEKNKYSLNPDDYDITIIENE